MSAQKPAVSKLEAEAIAVSRDPVLAHMLAEEKVEVVVPTGYRPFGCILISFCASSLSACSAGHLITEFEWLGVCWFCVMGW